MKKILQILFFFFLLTSLCFTQLYQPIKKTDIKKTDNFTEKQNKHFPIFSINVMGWVSNEFLLSYSRNQLNIGIDVPDTNSILFSSPHHGFLPEKTKMNPSPTNRTFSPQSQIYVIDTAVVMRVDDGYFPADTTRHLYSFNANAKRTSDLEQKLIGEYWVDTGRRTNTYDENNNMLTDLYEHWYNGQWVNTGRYTYTYDTQGNRLTELYEHWGNSQWVNDCRYTYTYDTQGNRLMELWEDWDIGQWVNDCRCTYTYDTQGNRLTSLYEDWDNGQWVNDRRYTYTYDIQGNMLTYLDEYWDNGQWVNYWRYTYTYDTQGNRLTELYEHWYNGQWVNTARYTYTYDTQGNMLTYLDEYWDNGQWVNYWRGTYTYNTQGNMLTDLYEHWDNGQWVNFCRSTYTYDIQGNLTSFWMYTWLRSIWVPMNLSTYNGFEIYDMAGNEYRFWGHNFTFIYEIIITEVVPEIANAPKIYSLQQNYPNPFNPSTTIEFDLPITSDITLKIFNILGEEVATLVSERLSAGSYSYEWDASDLASGVYLYKLQADNYVETRKMVLMR